MASKRTSGFRCAFCGQWHSHAATDFSFQLPDEVWALRGSERTRRATFGSNLCILDARRHFIRGLLMVPFTDRAGYLGWGPWVEVRRPDFDRYLDFYDRDGSSQPRFPGTIANYIQGYPTSYRRPVQVQLGPATQRPTLWLTSSTRHRLSSEQRHGIDSSRHHEILHVHRPGAPD
jgi:hypothetical protein